MPIAWSSNVPSVASPGGMGGDWPPNFVQTPSEISTNLLKSFFLYMEGGIACMYIVTFTAHQQRKMVRTPTFFWLATPLHTMSWVWISRGHSTLKVNGQTHLKFSCHEDVVPAFRSTRFILVRPPTSHAHCKQIAQFICRHNLLLCVHQKISSKSFEVVQDRYLKYCQHRQIESIEHRTNIVRSNDTL